VVEIQQSTGCSVKEIADFEGISVAATKSRLLMHAISVTSLAGTFTLHSQLVDSEQLSDGILVSVVEHTQRHAVRHHRPVSTGKRIVYVPAPTNLPRK
jgi:hypothetical protein